MKQFKFTPEQEKALKSFVDKPWRGGIKELSESLGTPYGPTYNFVFRERIARERKGIEVKRFAPNAKSHLSISNETSSNVNGDGNDQDTSTTSQGPILKDNVLSVGIKKISFENNRLIIELDV